MNNGKRLLSPSGNAGVLLFCLALSCVIPSGSVPEVFQMSMKDTVAPFGSIAVTFNNAVEESTVIMKLLPNNVALTAHMNKTNDTAIFFLPLSISGNSHYMLVPQFGNNSQMNKPGDTLFFHTWPKENEPNNSFETADSICSRMFGTISTIDDVDWFMVDSMLSTKCVLRNYGGNATLEIARKPGALVDGTVMDAEIATIPDTVNGLAFIVVYTPLKSAGGYYEITILR